MKKRRNQKQANPVVHFPLYTSIFFRGAHSADYHSAAVVRRMAGSSAQTAEKRQATKGLGDDPLDALLARLIVAPQANTYDRMNSGADDNGDSTSGRRLARGLADGSLAAEKRDPWDVLTEEVNKSFHLTVFLFEYTHKRETNYFQLGPL